MGSQRKHLLSDGQCSSIKGGSPLRLPASALSVHLVIPTRGSREPGMSDRRHLRVASGCNITNYATKFSGTHHSFVRIMVNKNPKHRQATLPCAKKQSKNWNAVLTGPLLQPTALNAPAQAGCPQRAAPHSHSRQCPGTAKQ